ncbi:hypothetical protein M409DRAFT_22292 [Zasmidium cellare ATCC 36951]|uniref:Uncharacterized protein n=1 Tax=Zasmidium cellare ATCC 36951 TaxID=1080233 RepID=A0A6A6CJS9_ZASCE|nr:uncharacterized protein M409DRAFT_22292 [Zasmidium cellare ATCC 36951]KAF2167484.1 hypothetical protein M409DRAFT_22292 [Zasmidium cellare ATCC 36951]
MLRTNNEEPASDAWSGADSSELEGPPLVNERLDPMDISPSSQAESSRLDEVSMEPPFPNRPPAASVPHIRSSITFSRYHASRIPEDMFRELASYGFHPGPNGELRLPLGTRPLYSLMEAESSSEQSFLHPALGVNVEAIEGSQHLIRLDFEIVSRPDPSGPMEDDEGHNRTSRLLR